MKVTMEQKLIDSRPESAVGNEIFISRTLAAVRGTSANETFERVMRTTNATKKERFIMKVKQLKHIPVGLAAALVLLTSGTAFAAYQLWLSPSSQVRTIEHTAKGERALLQLKNCSQLGTNATISIAPHSGLSVAQGADAIQAYCETNAVQQWALSALHVESSSILLPYTITSINGSTMKVAYQGDMRTLKLAPTTVYVSGGSYSSRAQLQVGNSIAYVSTGNTTPVKAVVELGLNATYYGTAMRNNIILHEPCMGNPGELCSNGGGVSAIDLYSYGEVGANPSAKGDWKMIEGTLVAYSSTSMVLKGSSDALYTVNTTENLISEFNTQYNHTYNGLTVAVGDTLQVTYRQPASMNGHLITSGEFENASLLVTGNVKTDAIQKY
jgi:hypothetical protein